LALGYLIQLPLNDEPNPRREEKPEKKNHPAINSFVTEDFVDLALLIKRIEADERNEDENGPKKDLVLALEMLGHFFRRYIVPVDGIEAERNDKEKDLDPEVSFLDLIFH